MSAERYVEIIMQDERGQIVAEKPTVYEDEQIERVYEFGDGAVVKYEWNDHSLRQFNHRFTLLTPPKPNPAKLKAGVIRTIEY